jgi:cell division protease FtsH
MIDQEVRRIVEEGETTARQVLTDHLDELHHLAAALLEFETLNGEEAKRAIKGEEIGREDNSKRQPRALSAGASAIPKSRRPGGWGDPRPANA